MCGTCNKVFCALLLETFLSPNIASFFFPFFLLLLFSGCLFVCLALCYSFLVIEVYLELFF